MQKSALLGISKAAVLLGVSPATVTRWANQGRLKVIFTVGGQRRVPMAEIEKVLNSPKEDRTERAERQTRAAREALAEKRMMPPKTPYTAEDELSFGDYKEDDVNEKSPLLTAFKGYEVQLSAKVVH